MINKMVDRGPTDGDLQRIRATFEQVEEFDPMSIGRDLVQRRAKDELRGHPNQDLREMLAEIRALTPADLAAALADAMGDAMAIIADGMEIGFHDPAFGWDRSVAGKTIRFGRGDDDYVLGSEGVSVVTSYDCTTILFDGLLVVEHVAPDQRLLIDERGSWIMVGPARRRSHRRFIDALDERVPQDVVVPERR